MKININTIMTGLIIALLIGLFFQNSYNIENLRQDINANTRAITENINNVNQRVDNILDSVKNQS